MGKRIYIIAGEASGDLSVDLGARVGQGFEGRVQTLRILVSAYYQDDDG